jgi:membrane-associated phospholipid phosphatase
VTSPSERPGTIFPGLRSRWWVVAGALVFAGTVAAGFVEKSLGPSNPELGIDITLSRGRNRALVAVSEAIHYGFGPVGATILVFIVCGYLWFRDRPVQSLAFGSVVTVGWLASALGKILVGRPRPPVDAARSLVAETGKNSFPSGHTAFAASLVLAITLVLAHSTAQRLAALVAGTLFVAVVAFSRMYLGVHYLSDVIGSVLISSAAILAWLSVWNHVIAPWLSASPWVHGLEARASERR